MTTQRSSSRPWFQTEGVWDGSHTHEPMAFVIRRGGCREDVEEFYEREFSEDRACQVARSGANFVETCFFKGLGLEFERPEMERTRRFIQFGHKHGLRMGVYTQWGSLFNETFFAEVPQARQWVQIGVDGRPIEYLDRVNQYFRWRGCPGSRDFLAYLKTVIDVAIREHKADVIYFDNMCLFEYHDTLCYCDCCRRQFREFLARKYPTPDVMFRALGIRSAEHVSPPPFRPWTDYTAQAVPIRDPMVIEFIEFRCHQLADAWHEIYLYIKSVDPAAEMMGNPSFPRKYNERLTSAIDFWLLRRTPAMYYMENAVRAVGIRDGAVVSNIRGYKYGRALGVTFVPCGGEAYPGLAFCEGLAFNDGSGHTCSGWEPYKKFFLEHREEFYRNVEPAAEVAILRDDTSLTLRWHEAFTVMELAQQMLLCAGIPWMPLWRQQLHDGTLQGYKVLVLPGNACVSARDADTIAAFVQSGGGLVILENAGTLNERHQTIARWRFARLFEGELGPRGFDIRLRDRFLPQFDRQDRPLATRFGEGRVIYLPQIRAARKPVSNYDEIGGYDGFGHLRLPRNWRNLAKAVEQVAPAPLAVRVAGPTTLMAEFLRKTGSRRLFVHLVNYARGKAAPGVKVRLGPAAGRKARLYLPAEGVDGRTLKPSPGKGGSASIRLPGFARYALVVVD